MPVRRYPASPFWQIVHHGRHVGFTFTRKGARDALRVLTANEPPRRIKAVPDGP